MALEITLENYEELINSDKPVLIDFYAEWCGPCKMLTPVVNALYEEYKDTAIIGKVNVDENRDLAAELAVMNIPLVLIIKNKEVKHRLIGALAKDKYKVLIDELL